MAANWQINGVTITPPTGPLSFEYRDEPTDAPNVYSVGNRIVGTVTHQEISHDPPNSTNYLTLAAAVDAKIAAIIANSAGDYATIVSPYFTINARIRICRPRFTEAPFTLQCLLDIEFEQVFDVLVPGAWTINGVTITPERWPITFQIDAIPSDEPGVFSTGNTGFRGTVTHVERTEVGSAGDLAAAMAGTISSIMAKVNAIMPQASGDYATVSSPYFSGQYRIKSARPRFESNEFTVTGLIDIEFEELKNADSSGDDLVRLTAWTINGAVFDPLDGPVNSGVSDIGASIATVPIGVVGRSYGNTGYRGTITHKERGTAATAAAFPAALAAVEAVLAAKMAAALSGGTIPQFADIASPYFSIKARITNASFRVTIEKPFTPVGYVDVSYEQVNV